MATVTIPSTLVDGDRRLTRRRLASWIFPAVVILTVVGVLAGLGLWVESILTAPIDQERTRAAEALIRADQAPAVAATARGRIVDLDCTLQGPIEVAPDGTGAFIVTAGARQVACPDEGFRTGFTLRWPPERQPVTEPLPS
jgi:hypothetical protein